MAIDPNALTVDYRELLKTTTNPERVSLTQSQRGREILSALTPTELSNMFPDYYKRNPPVSNYLSATSKKYSRGERGAPTATEIEKEAKIYGKRTSMPSAAKPSKERKDPIIRKMEEKIPGFKTEPGAKARLSKEHEDVVSDLKKGNIKEDDPKISFLKNIDDKTLLQAGIKRNRDTNSYEYVPFEPTKTEIENIKKPTVKGKDNKDTIIQSFSDQLRIEGVPEQNIPYATALLAGQVQEESGFNPNLPHDNNTGYGIYGARLKRREDMFNWLEKNNYAKNSPEGQARYMVYEAMNKKDYSPSRLALLNANKDNLVEGSRTLTTNFEKPKEQIANAKRRHANTLNILPHAQSVKLGNYISGVEKLSDDEIAKILIQQQQEKRSQVLAESQIPKNPPTGISEKVYENLNSVQRQALWNAIKDNPNIISEISSNTASKVNDLSGNFVKELQTGATHRKGAIKPELKDALSYAADQASTDSHKVRLEVTSGGQNMPGIEGGWATKPPGASRRHDQGGAADFNAYLEDKKTGTRVLLDYRNPEHRQYLEKLTESFSRAHHRAGVGMGYMSDPTKIHFGGPNNETESAIAYAGPDWFKKAHGVGIEARKKDIENKIDVVSDWKTKREKLIAEEKAIPEESIKMVTKEPVPASKSLSERTITAYAGHSPKTESKEESKTIPDPTVSDIPEFASGGAPSKKIIEAIQNPVLKNKSGSPTEDNIHGKSIKLSSSENLKYEGTQPRIESADMIESEKNKEKQTRENQKHTNSIIQKTTTPEKKYENADRIKENISSLNPTLEYISGPGSMGKALHRNDYGNSLPDKRQFASHLSNYQ